MGSQHTVLVSKSEPRLCYHLSRCLESKWDMKEVTIEQAREMGAVGCSECFADQGCVQYDFPFLRANEGPELVS